MQAMNMQAIEDFERRFERGLSAQDWEGITHLVEQYLCSDNFNTHIDANIVDGLLSHRELLDLAERVITKNLL